MKKNNKVLFLTLCTAFVMLGCSALILFGGFHAIKSSESEYDVTNELLNVPTVVDLDALEETAKVQNPSGSGSFEDVRKSLEHFEVNGVDFALTQEYAIPTDYLSAEEAAKLALAEFQKRFPNQELSETFYAFYGTSFFTISKKQQLPTANWSFQYKVDSALSYYPKMIVVDAITGKIIGIMNPCQDPIANAYSSEEPWISNQILREITKGDTIWTSIAYQYLRDTLSTNTDKVYFSDVTCNLSLAAAGIMAVSCIMKEGKDSLPISVLIDIKTRKLIGYFWESVDSTEMQLPEYSTEP